MGVGYTAPISRDLHIRVTDRQHRLLLEESVRTGLSVAELVRRCVDKALRPKLRPVVGGFHLNFVVTRAPDAAVVARLTRLPRRVRD
jgi:hypothetical protein